MKRLVSASVLLLILASAPGQTPAVLRLTFIGDIMAHGINYRMSDFHDIYAGVKDALLSDDLTIANLEFPVDETRPIAGYPLFNSRRAYWQAAVDSGVDVFSQANNHAFDQGVEGILQTLRSEEAVRAASGRPFTVSGIRGNLSIPFEPQEIRVKGLRVGFVAATQFINQSGPCPYVNLVNYRDAGAAEAFIGLVREESIQFDLFIVSYHCGVEYSTGPRGDLTAFFRRLLAAGAHVVFGHHPHVYQSFALEKSGGETRLVMPSMGNFISGMTWGLGPADYLQKWAPTGDSALLRVEVLRVGASTIIAKAEAVPISNYLNGKGEMVVGMLEELAGGGIPLSPAWKAYYRERLAVMKELMIPAPLR